MKSFPIEDVLTVATGILVSEDIDGAISLMSYMLNEKSLFTHQLPGAADICQPALEEQYPWLTVMDFSKSSENPQRTVRRIKLLKALYGEELQVKSIAEMFGTVRTDG